MLRRCQVSKYSSDLHKGKGIEEFAYELGCTGHYRSVKQDILINTGNYGFIAMKLLPMDQ